MDPYYKMSHMIYRIILYRFIDRLILLLYKELNYVKVTYIGVFLKLVYTYNYVRLRCRCMCNSI
jgi:hypothetical protein